MKTFIYFRNELSSYITAFDSEFDPSDKTLVDQYKVGLYNYIKDNFDTSKFDSLELKVYSNNDPESNNYLNAKLTACQINQLKELHIDVVGIMIARLINDVVLSNK